MDDAMSATVGQKVVVSGEPVCPLRSFPDGKVRIKSRPGKAIRLYVRNKEGIQEFCVKEVDGYWEPAFRIARNING
jgi:hypothetical protein